METNKDLLTLSRLFDLYVASDREDFIAQCDCEDSDVPEGVTQGVFLPDHTVMQCVAFVKDGTLHRFGREDLGEDPAGVVATTLEELVAAGDPRDR